MLIRQPKNPINRSIKTYPLIKSHSAAAIIIHGDKSSSQYLDSLMSYKKTFAVQDKERRQQQMARKQRAIQSQKRNNLVRQQNARKNDEKQLNKLYSRQLRAQQLYHSSELKNTLANSLPLDPISLQFHSNKRGRSLAAIEEEKGLNRVVRAHFLQTIGNSGYNIINGRSSINFDSIVPAQKSQAFEQKLHNLYSKFKLNPE